MDHDKLDTLKDLANYLRTEVDFLRKAIEEEYLVIDFQNQKFDSKTLLANICVSRFKIAKKGKAGGFRTVHKALSNPLENTLKILNGQLISIYHPNDHIHGFVKGRNIRSNAACHLEKHAILSVDIKDFFESVGVDKIERSLVRIGFKQHIANWISRLTTINGYLPQGFHTSPTIANIVTEDLDSKLQNVIGDIVYTRYADDLYFSSDDENDEIPLEIIANTITEFGFQLHPDKTKFMYRGRKQFVTGLTVFDGVQPRIAKKRKRNIRLEVYFITKFGYKRHIRNKLIKMGIDPKDPNFKSYVLHEKDKTINRLYGWLHFINSIEPSFARKYYSRLKKGKR